MKRTIFIVSVCFVATFAEAQKAVVVYTQQGTKTSYPTTIVQNLQFADGNLHVNLYDGTLATYGIPEIRKITFSDTDVSVPHSATTNALAFYPNPAHDVIILSGLSDKSSLIRIYSIDGRLVLQTTTTGNQAQIDINSLKKGIYIIKTENTSLKLQKL